MQRNRSFTLLEILVVISLIIILFGIGMGSIRELSGQMEQIFTASDARQLISSTIQESRRNQVPMVVKFKTGAVNNGKGTGEFVMQGSQNTLIGYWNFDERLPDPSNLKWKKGINRLHMSSGSPTIVSGVLGKGVQLSGSQPLVTQANERLNCDSDFYFECHLRANLTLAGSSTPIIYNGGNGRMVLSIRQSNGLSYLDATGLDGAAQSVPFPEDGLWHKIGLCKMQELGVYLYVDDLLIASKKVISSPGSEEHTLAIGESFHGDIDEVKFYKLGEGQTLQMRGNGQFFGFEAEPLASTAPQTLYYLLVSPLGVASGLYKEGSTTPLFKAHSYVHLQSGVQCTVDLGGTSYTTNNSSSNPKPLAQLYSRIKAKDQGFPDKGYAWARNAAGVAEIVRYEVRNSAGGQFVRVLSSDELGTDDNRPLGNSELTLQSVEPITITRSGDIL